MVRNRSKHIVLFVFHMVRVSLSATGIDSSNNESVTIGVNLSDVVYNDENGISMESAVW